MSCTRIFPPNDAAQLIVRTVRESTGLAFAGVDPPPNEGLHRTRRNRRALAMVGGSRALAVLGAARR